jgi:hypothetical protein
MRLQPHARTAEDDAAGLSKLRKQVFYLPHILGPYPVISLLLTVKQDRKRASFPNPMASTSTMSSSNSRLHLKKKLQNPVLLMSSKTGLLLLTAKQHRRGTGSPMT